MINVLLIFIGGGAGSVTRYGSTILAARFFSINFPWGTLFVNLVGCFLIGLLFGLADRGAMNLQSRLLLMTGFLGGLTTFSTYGLETTNLLRTRAMMGAFANIVASNALGLFLVFLGVWLVQRINLPGVRP